MYLSDMLLDIAQNLHREAVMQQPTSPADQHMTANRISAIALRVAAMAAERRAAS